MHIKSVELSHFKSFGGTAHVPLMPGFTVISGPNGSGKSNILDALLFALGLASSKGMRADRLPDLVNQSHMGRRSTAEAIVTVTFDIGDLPAELLQDEEDDSPQPDPEAAALGSTSESNGSQHKTAPEAAEPKKVVPLSSSRDWSVTRRLRVTTQGTYTSNYYINGEPCTLNQLHDQLQRFRVYPEGYNVVLQGDVTSIISMNSRERREIIDELAGVAAFDRKINQARDKLEVVRDREERFHIVERELQVQLERLAQDRLKAEKYQQLRSTLQDKRQWEAVLVWQGQQQRIGQLQQQLRNGAAEIAQLAEVISASQQVMVGLEQELSHLNARVKALGEEEHLALQSQLATQEAELRQIQRRQQDLKIAAETAAVSLRQSQIEAHAEQQAIATLQQDIDQLQSEELVGLIQARDRQQQALDGRREATSAIVDASQAWVQQQTELRHQIEALLAAIDPQRTNQVRLQEKSSQIQQQIQQLQERRSALTPVSDDQQPPAQALIATELA
ncbi:chromosome segregation protein SMC, partial [filamentous cyanobacterium CCP5]